MDNSKNHNTLNQSSSIIIDFLLSEKTNKRYTDFDRFIFAREELILKTKLKNIHQK